MNNYENFVESAAETSTKRGVAAAADASIRHPAAGYKTFDRTAPNSEHNVVEFVYSVEPHRRLVDACGYTVAGGRPAATMSSSYDVQQVARVVKATPFWTSVLRLLLLTCGTPLFVVPRWFASAGYPAGTALLLAVACVCAHTMHMVLGSAQHICALKCASTVSYSDLLYEALTVDRPYVGPKLGALVRTLSAGLFALTGCGVCAYLYLLAAENVRTCIAAWFADDVSVRQMLTLMVLPALALSLLAPSNRLESFAAFGFVCNALSVLLVLGYALADPSPWRLRDDGAVAADADAIDAPLYVGILLINVGVAPAILRLRDDARNSRNSRNSRAEFGSFGNALNVSVVALLCIYLPFLLTCSLKYGDRVPANAITIVPPEHPVAQISPLLYAVGVIFMYPYLLCGLLGIAADQIFGEKLKYRARFLAASTGGFKLVAVLASFCATYARPDLFLYASLGGTIGTSIDSLVYPALVHTLVEWRVTTSPLKFGCTLIKNLLILAAGLYLVVMGVEYVIRVA